MWYLLDRYDTDDFDDPRIRDMDPVRKAWMYNNWIEDINDKAELLKQASYLVASFFNPEGVKKAIGTENKHISSDEEFEESTKIVREANLEFREQMEGILNQDPRADNNKRKRRRIIK